MTTEAAEGICQRLGQVIHCSDKEETDGGEFMRVRVELDIMKPLSHGRWVRFGPDNKGWVMFRYERFPIFCYWCGRLTHDDGDCDIWIRSKGTLRIEDQPFRDWMRAPLLSMSRRKLIWVPGQEKQWMIAPRGNETPLLTISTRWMWVAACWQRTKRRVGWRKLWEWKVRIFRTL